MEHNLKIDWKTGKMEWPKTRPTPDWVKIRQKSDENQKKSAMTISTLDTPKPRYIAHWTKIRQKTMENIKRKFIKDNRKQDTPEPTKPRWRFSKIRRNNTSEGQLETDNTHNLPKEEGDNQEQAIMKTIRLMEPPEDKLFIARMDETEEIGKGQTETDGIWINAKTNIAMKLAIEENMKKQELPVEQQVPLEQDQNEGRIWTEII